nr:general odorant-binding protein 56d-like isoform X2 [Onthophagus taurus]
MKLFFLVLVLIVIVANGYYLSDEQKAKIKEITRRCIEQTGVDPNVLLQTKRGVFTEDPKLKSFLFCSFTNSGIQDSKGAIQEDVVKSIYRAEPRAIQAFQPCFGKTGEDGLIIAYETFKCFRTNLPEDLKLML